MSACLVQCIMSESQNYDKMKTKNVANFPIDKESGKFKKDIKCNMLVRKYIFAFYDVDKNILQNCILKSGRISLYREKRQVFTPYLARVIDNAMYGDKVPDEHIYSITFDKLGGTYGLLNEGDIADIILELEFEPQSKDVYLELITLSN